jgi:hypothetical protein
MIKISGQLCYSPVPPSRYARPHLGLGISCRDDVQLWNLLYLSCESIEDHRDPSSDDYAHVLVNRDLAALYTSQAALNGANCRELFPGLRDALKQHPTVFMNALTQMPWANLPHVRTIPNWIDIVISKVATIEASAKIDLARLLRCSAESSDFAQLLGVRY